MKYFFSFILAIVLFPTTLFAVDADNFNPNFLISDAEMQDVNTMNISDIQAFLREQPGTLSSLITEDLHGVRRSAADIIYNASKEHGINPKYLLVKLQKEQSLVTDPNPTQKKLDGATGYGITDGCGWDCDTYKENKGFGKQVDSAAGIMRWYYDNMNSQSWIKRKGKTYTISGQKVTPESDATGLLYTYTPHILGNKNFWLIWQRWFDQGYPNGTLAKVEGNPTVYLIQGDKRRAFGNLSALTSRFNKNNIITISESELARYSEGPAITLSNYSVLQEGNNFYLLDFETIRPFESRQTMRDLGYHPDEIIQVTPEELTGLTRGEVITANSSNITGEIVRIKESGSLFYRKNNTLYPINDPAIAKTNFPTLKEKTVSLSELPPQEFGDPILFRDGSVILTPISNAVYVIENGKKRHITTEYAFLGLGYRWDMIIKTNAVSAVNHKTGEPIYLRNSTSASPSPPEQGPEEPDDTENGYPSWEEIQQKMIRTPKGNWEFVAAEFATDIDSYLVYDVAQEKIILGKNIDSVRPTASLAKLFTAHVLLQEGLKLQKITTYSAAEHKSIYHRFRVAEGERIYNTDLLDAMLVSSLNTPVNMLVNSVEPNDAAFVSLLNTKAKELGLSKTNFTIASGEKEDTVTTAREYLEIYKTAIRSSAIKKSLSKKEYRYAEYKDLDNLPDHKDNHSNNLMHSIATPGYSVVHSKTGYLWESGSNIAMLIKRDRDGKEFIVITLGDVNHPKRFVEPARLSSYVIENF